MAGEGGIQNLRARIAALEVAGPGGGGGGTVTVLRVDGGAAGTAFPDYLLRLDFGKNGATI